MSLSLKPLSIDSNSKQLDSKQKKFHANVERALQHFDSVTEWADYIASLGKLLKALQSWSPQFQNVKYYIPFPYQVARRLASSLSPNLPSGVHQKTLEVYTFIFDKIGIETLGKECNIWVSGILPLMSYASISVKGHLIELYDKFLVQLPSPTLRILVKPLIASLLPGIDDESSEFQPLTMDLIETLKENLADDSLFWQTCFIVMITNKDRRLGGLIWLTKKLPSLNAVPHLVAKRKKDLEENPAIQKQETLDKKGQRDSALSLLLPNARDIVSPEPGLLIRCLISCLGEDNDIIIQRGILDLLLQRVLLDSPVLQTLVSPKDKELLVMGCCKTMLKRDMSLNRRIWNWLLGPNTNNQQQPQNKRQDYNHDQRQAQEQDYEFKSEQEQEYQQLASKRLEQLKDYFPSYGLQSLSDGLFEMIGDEKNVANAFKICLALMDRWEIGSHIVPKMFIPLMEAAHKFQDDHTLKSASIFFDAVETNIIWGKMFETLIKDRKYEILKFVLASFNIVGDEEIIVRHLPLILLALLIVSFEDSEQHRYGLCKEIIDLIPERAYLPIQHSKLHYKHEVSAKSTLEQISDYYALVSDPLQFQSLENSADLSPPFNTEDLTFLTLGRVHSILIDNLASNRNVNQASVLFVALMEKIPEHPISQNKDEKQPRENWSDDSLIEAVFSLEGKLQQENADSVFGVVEIYSNYLASKLPILDSVKLLKIIVVALWSYLINPNKQMEAVRCLDSLKRYISAKYIESALAHAFVKEKDISLRLNALEALWTQLENHIELVRRPLELILDELFDEQNPNYLNASKWILSTLNSGSANRLFQVLVENLLACTFIHKEHLDELDDVDLFTYRVQTLTNVLKSNDGIVLKNFGTELTSVHSLDTWKGEDISTYKNLVLVVLLKFLNIGNNTHSKGIRSSLILLDSLLDGSEHNFKTIVSSLLQLSSDYITLEGLEEELIAVSLLNIVSKVLSLSHEKQIKLDIFDDNNSHVKYVDFLVTSVSSMEKPLVIASYIKLLSESITYFQNSIFKIILPLTTSITKCVEKLFEKEKTEGGNYQSVSLLINGLEELLEVSQSYLSADEGNGYLSSTSSRNDFLQNMVSNVFFNESGVNDSKVQSERHVILESLKRVVYCCFDIWVWAHKHSNIKETDSELCTFGEQNFQQSLHHQAYKYKFKSKKLLEKLFTLKPLEVLEDLVERHASNLTITLVHVLDGNRPVLTLPYMFQSIISRCNRNSSTIFSTMSHLKRIPEPSPVNKLDVNSIMTFIIDYISTLEKAAMEDFYNDFMLFIREVSNNYQAYDSISTSVLKMTAIFSEKIDGTKFGEQKRVRRDISDVFHKYLSNALDSDIESNVDAVKIFRDLEFVSSKLRYIISEVLFSDKFNNCVSIIVTHAITPYFKFKAEKDIPDYVLRLALSVAKSGNKVKNWKLLIGETFHDDKKFALIVKNRIWRDIIFEWSQYPENKERLMGDLVVAIGSKGNTITPTINPFNAWSESEVTVKFQNMARVAYLLMLSPKDSYLLHFQAIMSQMEQHLVSTDPKVKSMCFVLLRSLWLQFSPMHFTDYWSVLCYCLQTNLQNFYECLQIQQDVEPQLVLHICKTLDLLLALNIEEFSSTQEWLFVIDTINCIYKTDPYMSLVDEISDCKDYEMNQIDEVVLADLTEKKVPLLNGVHMIAKHSQLRSFFQSLSYAHYETMYSMKQLDFGACKADVLEDIFAMYL